MTEAGAFFYNESEQLLQRLQSLCLQTQEIARGNSGHLIVGVTEASAFCPGLALVFSKFRSNWPAVTLAFSQRQATDLTAALNNRQVDVAFTCPLPVNDSGLTQHALASEQMLLTVPVSHPLAKRRTVPLKCLKDEPIIVASHGPVARPFENTLDEACRKEGFSPRLVQMCPEYILALNLVAAGVGLTFVPKYMANARSDALRSLLVRSKLPLTVELCLVTRANDPSPMVNNLKNVVISLFTKAKGKLHTLTLAGSSDASS